MGCVGIVLGGKSTWGNPLCVVHARYGALVEGRTLVRLLESLPNLWL